MVSKSESPLDRAIKEDHQKQILESLAEIKAEISDLRKKFDFLYNAMNSNARKIRDLEEK
ncbi:MAG: hypothetical protein HZR80_20860 [Candidatus Heimdallarchaeota archaeon]